MAVKRRCFVMGPRRAAQASSWGPGGGRTSPRSSPLVWSASTIVAEADVGEAPCRGALAGRPGCAALPAPIDRLALHSAAVLVAAGCSALLAAPGTTGGSVGCAALLALAPGWMSRLPRSLLPSTRTAFCNSLINVAGGSFLFSSFWRTFHDEQRGATSSRRGVGFFMRTATAAFNRWKAGALDASLCVCSHRLSVATEVN